MARNWTKEHSEAEKIIKKYKWYHAGTAVVVGGICGKVALDRIPLTALTISMIKDICWTYGITEPLPVAIHCISAIARLTYKGTLTGTLLNWMPGGSLINGGVTFVLTSECGHECMSDIERDRMGSVDQLLLAFGRSTVTFACEAISKTGDKISGEIIDGLRESLEITDSLDKVKTVVSGTLTGTAMSAMSGEKILPLREFLLHTVPSNVLNVSFMELAQKNGSFVDNRNAVVWRLTQMRTEQPVFADFDNQLDGWISQIKRTPDKKALYELVKLLDKEFSYLFGNSIPINLAGKNAAWIIANQAGRSARNGVFASASS